MVEKKIDILKDFFSISTWQSLIAILIFTVILISFWYLIRKTKMRFSFRIFIAIGLGLVFALSFQAIINFPKQDVWNETIKGELNSYFILWVFQTVNWISLLKTLFINGMLMLSILVVFLAIARVVAKPNTSGLAAMSFKSIIILLINVAVAFSVTFFIGYAFNIGQGLNLQPLGERTAISAKTLPDVISGYMPANFIGAFVLGAVIPIIVIAALVGYAIKKQTKRYEKDMNHSRDTLERAWKIVMSMLMTFVRYMPFAVFAMVTTAIIGRPIAVLADIGKVMGTAYLGLLATLIWLSVSLIFFNINPWQWWKSVLKPFIQGFATQSSQATLPLAMEVMQYEMKVKEQVVNLTLPLASTMGLAGCAGVQAGIVLMFVYNGAIEISSQYSLTVWFLMGLIVTLVTSLGIAGVPGTAPLVTAGVLAGLGVPAYYNNVYTYLGAMDGILDMGRTSVNVVGGVQATTIVARMHRLIDNPGLLLFDKNRPKKVKKIKIKSQKR